VVQELFPERSFELWDGIEVLGKDFQPYYRVMPHGEYPSGSSCICQGVEDYVVELWPSLDLPAVTTDNVEDYPVILPNTEMSVVPGTGFNNPSAKGYTPKSLNARCGDTRLEGGLHFTAAVPDGRTLCQGMGTKMAEKIRTLNPEGGSVAGTAPCNAACEDPATGCVANEDCDADPFKTPWFPVLDVRTQALALPDGNGLTSSDMPYAQVDRNHLLVLGTLSALTPPISQYETSIQFRLTNTIDNLMWNSIAAFSNNLRAVKFGQTNPIDEPTVKNADHQTTDSKIMTALHSIGCALPILLPEAVELYHETLAQFMDRQFENGFDPSLEEACTIRADKTDEELQSCIQTWVADQADKTPAVMGNAIAFEIMYHKNRDGWNSLGTEGGCWPEDPHFCPRYADTGGYKPISGECATKTLQSSA
jgi:hypothetical protein